MSNEELKCPHCGATKLKNGEPFKNRSALNTHINVHCPKKPLKPAGGCKNGEEHKYKLINPQMMKNNRFDFARALNDGYTKICEKCGDLQ